MQTSCWLSWVHYANRLCCDDYWQIQEASLKGDATCTRLCLLFQGCRNTIFQNKRKAFLNLAFKAFLKGAWRWYFLFLLKIIMWNMLPWDRQFKDLILWNRFSIKKLIPRLSHLPRAFYSSYNQSLMVKYKTGLISR